MNIATTCFGTVMIDDGDVLTFTDGLIGMEDHCRWVLLADEANSALAWLQSVDRPEVALAVVDPRRFHSGYRVRVAKRDVELLGLTRAADAQVVVIVNQVGDRLAVNLKAPLVIHLEQRLGRQVIAKDDHPVQYFVAPTPRLRKSA